LRDHLLAQPRGPFARVVACVVLVVAAVGLPAADASAGVRGDFNGDGRGDLAIGVPGARTGAADDAGAVTILYGSSGLGLQIPGSQTLREGTAGVPDKGEPGDQFGAAMAAGDFDGDGSSDLAIGAPGKRVAGAAGAGRVTVLYGSRTLGLVPSGVQVLSEGGAGVPDASESGDHLGAALVTGDFDGDGRDDLAIGAPGESTGASRNTGTVILLFGSPRGLEAGDAQQLGIGAPAGGEQYGAALAAGDFDADARDDLVVGAPGTSGGSGGGGGTVDVLYGLQARLVGPAQELTGHAMASTGAFGFALSVGDFDADGSDDLAVGAPGAAKSGRVTVLYGSPGTGLVTTGPQVLSPGSGGVPGSNVPGDRFGAALAGGDFDGNGHSDLAIGVPGETIGGAQAAGQVTVLYGGAARLQTSAADTFSQTPAGTQSHSEPGDVFASALSAADFNDDGDSDLAIGAPGENTNSSSPTGPAAAGQITVLYGHRTGLSTAAAQKFSREDHGLGAPGQAGDRFGSAFPPSAAPTHTVPSPVARLPPAPPTPPASPGAATADASTPPIPETAPSIDRTSRSPAAPTATQADIAAVSLPRHVSTATLHRRGLHVTLRITPWRGSSARVVRMEVIRVGAQNRHRLIDTEYQPARSPGALTLTLHWPRRQHFPRPGHYQLGTAVGTSRSHLRKTVTVNFTVT
jgi:FG-GAP repeat protein